MDTVQLATRIEKRQDQLFRETTRKLGMTPADALRVFITAFNRRQGFPFEVRLEAEVEPFETEAEATGFAAHLSRKMIDEAQ
jgi:DNA-damage-inducible protein J